MRVNQRTLLAGIPITVKVLKAVTMQLDKVLSFRTGQEARKLHGVTTGILSSSSLATKS
jgi:hypothetical protein